MSVLQNKSLIEVINQPIPGVSDRFKICYWEIQQVLSKNATNPDDIDLFAIPYYRSLDREERAIIGKAIKRHRARWDTQEPSKIKTRTDLARLMVSTARGRRYSRHFMGKSWKLSELLDQFVASYWGHPKSDYTFVQLRSWLAHNKPLDLRKQVGEFLRNTERTYIETRASKPLEGEPYYLRLPLYECSGELECSRANYQTRVARIDREYWKCGYDGGGQPEIRFRIKGTLPNLACKQVIRLGPGSRNGGHIHLNCKKDEWIGQRTYFAFRYHLSWFRYLETYTRRNHRHTAVDATQREWRLAKRYKFAAISANKWDEFGTVEIRLWGPTRNSKEWLQRSEFMKAMARWAEFSETYHGHSTPELRAACPQAAAVPTPGGFTNPECRREGYDNPPVPHWLQNPPLIRNDNSRFAWMDFARWAAVGAPDVLRWVLKKFRAKASHGRDARARDMAAAYIQMFNESDIRLARYRRPRVITPQPPTIPGL